MVIEQMSIDDIVHLNSDYNIQSKPGIYPKIDWLTFMFSDVTISYILDFLDQSDHYSDFIKSLFIRGGYCPEYIFSFNNIRISLAGLYTFGVPEGSLFDLVVPTIRLDISGQGLDYLRSCGWEFYNIRHRGNKHFHITRCDWAFDFIDYKPEFYQNCIQFIRSNLLPSGRIPLASSRGAVGVELTEGTKAIIRLGSTASDRSLRIYDKKLQLFDYDLLTWKQKIPYDNPNSWFRIEMQLRNNNAHGSVLPDKDGNVLSYLDILKQIFDKFAFSDARQTDKKMRKSVDFWYDIFPWDEVQRTIIQNAKYVLPKSREERVRFYVENMACKNNLLYVAKFGLSSHIAAMNDYLQSIQPGTNEFVNNPYSDRQWTDFLNALAELGVSVPSEKPSDGGLYSVCGRLVVSL